MLDNWTTSNFGQAIACSGHATFGIETGASGSVGLDHVAAQMRELKIAGLVCSALGSRDNVIDRRAHDAGAARQVHVDGLPTYATIGAVAVCEFAGTHLVLVVIPLAWATESSARLAQLPALASNH